MFCKVGIEVFDVVAGDILAVLHKLDGMPKERTAMHAGDEALDDVLGAQVETRDARDRLRVEEAARVVFEVFGRGGHWEDS